MTSIPCGTSDERNDEYHRRYSRYTYFRNLTLAPNSKPIIFDIGAHKGESIEFFREIFPSSTIYAFEPCRSSFDLLTRVYGSIEDTFLFNLAVSSEDTKLTYYQQSLSHLGSCLKINNLSHDSISYAATAKNIPTSVSGIKLDTFVRRFDVSHIDILKIDVQGYESSVLDGALDSLGITNSVIIEVGFYDFYSNSSSFDKILSLMYSLGFVIYDIAKISKNPKTLGTDWAEFVFKRISPPSLPQSD